MKKRFIFAVLLVVAAVSIAGAQPPATSASKASARDSTGAQPLTLADAVRLASRSSENVAIAVAEVKQARSQQLSARNLYLPQVSATGSYSRTLASPFQNLTTQTTDSTTGQSGSSNALSRAGFGALNTYNFGLSGSFGLFSPGRADQRRSADAGRRSADIEVTAQRAQMVLDVTQAYYDAALSDQLVTIADSSLAQSERVLRQTEVAKNVGQESGYEVLRARVTHDNLLPTVLQQRSNREVAYIKLRQLVGLDADAPIRLTDIAELASHGTNAPATPAENDLVATLPQGVARGASSVGVKLDIRGSDTSVSVRAPVRQQEEAVRQQEATLRYTRAQRLPSLNLSASFAKLGYPANLYPTLRQLYSSASVGLSVSVPLYTGTRQLANEVAAEASVDRARAQLSQTRKSAALEARQARLTLAQVEAALASLAETAGQATRAYEIAEVRFQEGLASQTELSDARIAEAQALSNRASAVRDLLVARVRLALLADLPLSATTSATGGLTNAASGSSTTTTSNSTQGASGGSTSTTSGTTTSTRTSTAGQTTP